ncbi:MAG: hypothetical protein KA105_01315 [Caulobacter sp.]|nr:hypothetical protein [Caulobacter sp.]
MAAYTGDSVRTEIITRRHGDWARVERKEGETQLIQQVHLPTGVIVERADNPGGAGVMSIRAPDSAPTPGIDYASRQTKRSWKAAGQKCKIWEVYRGVDAGYTTFTRFGCVTRDGIEVARWTSGRTGADLGERVTGYYLYRGKMDDKDVRPTATSLNVVVWLGADPAAPGGDYEVVLKAEGSSETIRIRRHGAWTSAETVNGDGSRDIFADRSDGVTVSARIGAAGAPVSYIARRGLKPEEGAEVRLPQLGETVLGQACDWYDVMPNAADAGRHECRTAGGEVLVVRKFVRDEATTYRATTLERRPLTTSDLLPPAWLLDLSRWGAG